MLLRTRFPARHEVPEFGVFASLLRMTSKYGYFGVRYQLVKDLGGAYPTRWEGYQTAEVVGEDVFGSPKPHPNAILKLFSKQNIRFAVPFAAYRASSDGFSALMSDKPGAVLPHRTLATTIHGMHLVRALMGQAARAIVYEGNLGVCVDRKCVLSVGIEPFERRAEALKKLHAAFLVMRDGGELGPPSLGHLACPRCTEDTQASHATWGSMCWERLPSLFSVARSWSEV